MQHLPRSFTDLERPIHTSAICDCRPFGPETRTSLGVARTTAENSAVYERTTTARKPKPHAAVRP
jgi:hypothetical protein